MLARPHQSGFSPTGFQVQFKHLALTFIVAILASSAGAVEAPRRAVLAHYMVCCARAGLNASVDDLDSEISLAESYGIDGFVLNGGWYARYPANAALVDRMFKAAERHKSFGLVFSFDQSESEEAVQMVTAYGRHSNMMTKDGRVVVSGWWQTPRWVKDVKDALAARGIPSFMTPQLKYPWRPEIGFAPETSDVNAARSLLNEVPELDGYFYFGAGSPAATVSNSIEGIAKLARSHDKLFMCGVSAFYRGFQNNSRVFETDGFSGMRERWMKAIESKADWIQLVTWNDWSEATYLQPFDRPLTSVWNIPGWQNLPDHSGFLGASRYYINWFKHGRRPALQSDTLFYFYQLHANEAQGIVDFRTMERGRPKFWEKLTNKFHLAAFLTHPLAVTIKIGAFSYDVELPEGDSVTSVPLSLGKVEVIQHTRTGDISIQLPLSVGANADIGNFNYFTGQLQLGTDQ
ncbi:glycoside hydrolase family 71 protein [Bradyrhizobium sp. 187]|uniref:glycoside hydrolase family 71 protein n=1 Tax=Bradyrhizobium sp. 187 TaxID=2782655 RepID=UPI0020003962|nr:glycoside hydrolase family 71 protein [Bradyrhizobium sp. 187]UPJ74481.1 hypothetical protein IVB19_08085 [Bradyrhizobium sp. 187]